MTLLLGCGAGERLPLDPELRSLSVALRRAAEPGSLEEEEQLRLVEELRRVLPVFDVPFPGHETVLACRELEDGGFFELRLVAADGSPAMTFHFLYRIDLDAESVPGWERESFEGHPATGFSGEHLFVWPGRMEIRAFAEADALRDEERIRRTLALFPLDDMARL